MSETTIEQEKIILQRMDRAIKLVIEEQIKTNDPPEVEEAFLRLVEEKENTEEEAYQAIGKVVSRFFSNSVFEGHEFDMEAYKEALDSLT